MYCMFRGRRCLEDSRGPLDLPAHVILSFIMYSKAFLARVESK